MNIVEGFGRRGKADKLRFYNIAEASLNEAELPAPPRPRPRLRQHPRTLREAAGDVSRMLNAYATRIRSAPPPASDSD